MTRFTRALPFHGFVLVVLVALSSIANVNGAAAADTDPPTGSILIDGGAASTGTTEVILNLSASDTGGSGLASMRFRNSTADPYGAWEPYQTTRSWSLTSGAGTKRVYVQFIDAEGNISDANPTAAGAQGYSDAIELSEAIAPTGSILINGGAAATVTAAVILNLSASDTGGSGLASMRFRNSTAEPYSAWEPYQTTKSWSLTGGAGTKKVYVQFIDAAGNISDANPAAAGDQGYSDAIELLEAIAPTGSILIDGGAASTSTTAVILNLSAVDTGGSGLASMRFRNNTADPYSAWEPFQTTRPWLLTSGAGTKRVYVQFMDAAGNVSDANPAVAGAQGYSDSILLDESALPTGSILINDGAASTSSTTVQLTLSASDNGGGEVGSMRFRNAGEDSYGAWEAFQTTTAWVLSSGSGIKSVYVQFMDLEGNISDADPAAAGSQGYMDEILFTDPGAPTTCEGCHGGNPDYPLAPNVMGDGIDPSGTGSTPKPYDDGLWGYNVNGHGANGTATNTPKEQISPEVFIPYLDPDAPCIGCHDISLPATGDGRHLNGILNSVDGKSNPSENTAHLRTDGPYPFIVAGVAEHSVQVGFDTACYLRCHQPGGVSNMRHARDLILAPAIGHETNFNNVLNAVCFGDKGTVADGESIAYPIDTALTTNASTAADDFAPCISCHNPHGTPVVEPLMDTTRMLRDEWISASTLCLVCHQ